MEQEYDPLSIVREEMKNLWGKRYKEGCKMEHKHEGGVYPKINFCSALRYLPTKIF